MATLKSLGWNATEDRTDPPSQPNQTVQLISDGYEGLLLRERENHTTHIYMENPVEIEP